MARGGYRTGAGRPSAQRNVKTLEAELAAAQQQLVEMSKKRQAGRKLAIDVLDDVMHLAMGLAAKHQPLNQGEVAIAGQREPDDPKFVQYLELTIDTAGRLANFQSPKFKSTTISIETPTGMPGDGVAMLAPARRVSAAEAYRQLRESSTLVDVTPISKVDKVPAAKKAARG